jgi:hypothetical protein
MKTLEQIRQMPLSERTVMEEYALAKQEHRQPFCVYCEEELYLTQTRFVAVELVWEVKKGRFVEGEYDTGGLDMPACSHCHRENWDFIDEKTTFYRILW